MDIPLNAPPLRILGGNDALARGAELFGLDRELTQSRLELECEAEVGERRTGLCRQIGQEFCFGGAEHLPAALPDGNLADWSTVVKHQLRSVEWTSNVIAWRRKY